MQLQVISGALVNATAVDLQTPGEASACAASADTTASDAGLDSVVVACPDQSHLYAAENIFTTGAFTALWDGDGGTIRNVHVLPSYARATIFWSSNGAVLMGQVNGPPIAVIAELPASPTRLDLAASIRGGYLLSTVFDGGQGTRAYGAYVCPP